MDERVETPIDPIPPLTLRVLSPCRIVQEAAAVVCCFRYWEKGSSGEGELFAIYIFISVIDAQLAFVSFTKGYWEGRAPSRPPSAGRMSGCPVVPMNDDPMKTARGCHPNIIQLDNRASEQRGTFYKCANV